MNMNRVLLATACLVGFSVASQAHLDDRGYQLWSASDPKDVEGQLETWSGLSLDYLAKNDREKVITEDGAVTYAGHFWVDYQNDGKEAVVQWDLNDTDFILRYVLVKDGVPQGNDKYYHIYEVSLDQYKEDKTAQTIVFNIPPDPYGTPQQRAISHISFYGQRASVPDGGMTAALLGLGMLGVGFVARRKV